MNQKWIFLIVMLETCLFCVADAAALKKWPSISGIVLKSSTVVEGDNFSYFYTLCNSPKNSLSLYHLEIDLRTNPLGHPLAGHDLTLKHSAEEHAAILRQAGKLIPSYIGSPLGWGSDYPGLWGVDDLNAEFMIKPGQCLTNYAVVSTTPVSIREFVADAYSMDFLDNPEDYEFPGRKLSRKGDPDELTTEVNKGIQYLGETIAPVAPPEPFTVSSWTIRMTEDAIEARRQKWIKTDKALAEVQKLINALNTEDKVKLRIAVKNIGTYVLAEKKKGNLTDEADALVRLNAQYLLRRLEQPAEKPDDGAKK